MQVDSFSIVTSRIEKQEHYFVFYSLQLTANTSISFRMLILNLNSNLSTHVLSIVNLT
jgi:hypothetical protein